MERSFAMTLCDILFYNGYLEPDDDNDDVSKMIKALEEYDDEYAYPGVDIFVDINHKFKEWGTEEHTIWMMLVGAFGDWGTSIRSGWISDKQGCIEYLKWCKDYFDTNSDCVEYEEKIRKN